MNQIEDYDELKGLARQARWLAISTVAKSGAGHVGGPFSATQPTRAYRATHILRQSFLRATSCRDSLPRARWSSQAKLLPTLSPQA